MSKPVTKEYKIPGESAYWEATYHSGGRHDGRLQKATALEPTAHPDARARGVRPQMVGRVDMDLSSAPHYDKHVARAHVPAPHVHDKSKHGGTYQVSQVGRLQNNLPGRMPSELPPLFDTSRETIATQRTGDIYHGRPNTSVRQSRIHCSIPPTRQVSKISYATPSISPRVVPTARALPIGTRRFSSTAGAGGGGTVGAVLSVLPEAFMIASNTYNWISGNNNPWDYYDVFNTSALPDEPLETLEGYAH